jgi:hypothetical protein
VKDRILIKHHGDPEVFVREATRLAPETQFRILEPGEPLKVAGE